MSLVMFCNDVVVVFYVVVDGVVGVAIGGIFLDIFRVVGCVYVVVVAGGGGGIVVDVVFL